MYFLVQSLPNLFDVFLYLSISFLSNLCLNSSKSFLSFLNFFLVAFISGLSLGLGFGFGIFDFDVFNFDDINFGVSSFGVLGFGNSDFGGSDFGISGFGDSDFSSLSAFIKSSLDLFS